MYKKIIIITFIFIFGSSLGYFIYAGQNISFAKLNPEQMYNQIIKNRDFAIKLAQGRGEYKCCINPPCTMCYDGSTKWNYGQPGKCFCDEFIARGENPCPQCQKGLDCAENSNHGSEADAFCNINSNP